MIQLRDYYESHIERTKQTIEKLENKLANSGNAEPETVHKISVLRKSLVDYSTYNTYMTAYFKKFSEKLIKEGEQITLPGKLGIIFVKRKPVVPRIMKNGSATYPVLWGESNKKKAEILERGGTPYDKDLAPHGEKWLVYQTEGDRPILMWSRDGVFRQYHNYFIYPSRGTKGFVARLNKFVKKSKNNILRYRS